MKARFMTSIFLSVLASRLAAEGVTSANIHAGKLVPGSISPDKKHCLLEVFHNDTTQNSVIFSPSDRTANLGHASLSTVWSSDIPYKKRTVILWSPDSSSVALHDSLYKHSVLAIYRRGDHEFAPLTLPALLDEACKRWSVDRGELVSSGQRPVRWDANDKISIELTAKRKAGEKLSTIIQLRVPKDGPVEIIKRP
jgi:hypothetical protein